MTKEDIINKIEGLIESGNYREGFVKHSCLCEAYGMALLARELKIITNEEARMFYNKTILPVLVEVS